MPLSPYTLGTVAELRELGRVKPADASDALLERLLNVATVTIEDFLHQQVKPRSRTETTQGDGRTRELILAQRPIISVSWATISGDPLAATDYEIDGPNGILRLVNAWGSWGDRQRGPAWPRTTGSVVVVYIAGYSPVPDSLVQVALEVALKMYQAAGRDAMLKSETLGPWSWTAKDSAAVLDDDLKERLAPYGDTII